MNRKSFSIACFILLFVCCKEPQSSSSTVSVKESRYKELLSLFKEKSFDTLHVYSPEENRNEYKGVEIDSISARLFPQEIAESHFSNPPGLFAVYKFALDSGYLGLITRTPSEYEPSSIKLFFYDQRRDTITSWIELAERWGDAGDYTIKRSWIYKTNDKKTQSLILETQGHDNSVDNENDTTVVELDFYYLLGFNKSKPDTLSTDSTVLAKKFFSIINTKNRK